MSTLTLLLGSNLGKRQNNLERAVEEIHRLIGTVTQVSSVYETQPVGFSEPPTQWFLNQALVVKTRLTPLACLQTSLHIEKQLGRMRPSLLQGYSSRLIDVDILFYNQEVVESSMLTVPHPEIQNRRFTLLALHEIMPDFVHPTLGRSIAELVEICPDQSEVRLFAPQKNW